MADCDQQQPPHRDLTLKSPGPCWLAAISFVATLEENFLCCFMHLKVQIAEINSAEDGHAKRFRLQEEHKSQQESRVQKGMKCGVLLCHTISVHKLAFQKFEMSLHASG